ncbi:MAG: hypothetical protein M3T55_07930 [Pseudomonadota bacterium]|nr:hypothetical protein [Pseudomonadota bacterium]
MSVLRIFGVVICVIAGIVIWRTMSTLGRANERLRAAGCQEPVPLTPAMRAFIAGIHIIFAIGLALIFLTH